MAGKPDFLLMHAREAFNLPANWHWYKLEAVGPHESPNKAILVTGAVVTAIFTRGPRKGSLNFGKRDRKTECTVPISARDHEAWLLQWEESTGQCHECGGTGQAWVGWSKAEGHRYRTCHRCDGTGKAPALARARGEG